MTNIVENYKTILKAVPELIKISGYKNEYVARKLGIEPAYFSKKKKLSAWTVDEVQKILDTISNKEVEDYLDAKLIKNCFEGKRLSTEEFEKSMGWK